MKNLLKTMTIALLLTAFGANVATADGHCFIGGTITAAMNDDPDGPAWVYTGVVDWDTQQGLSHLGVILDIEGGNCTCEEFHAALMFGDPIGYSDGHPDCTVDYYGEINCQGDPSIDYSGVVLKIEPYENGCEPGNSGQVTFTFYSNLPPAPIDEEILTVVEKDGQNVCWGNLTGYFPAMDCDPVGDQLLNFGNVKGLFR